MNEPILFDTTLLTLLPV